MVRAARSAGSRRLYEKLLQQLVGPLLLAVGIFYFSFHALSGERGLYALLKEERKLELVKGELADITAKRKALEQNTRLLNDGSLDLDMLDERSRLILNDVSQDEVIIPLTTAAPAGTQSSH